MNEEADAGPPTPRVSFEPERGVYGLQLKRNVTQVVCSVGDDVDRSRRVVQLFKALAANEIAASLIKLHRTVVTLAIRGADCDRAEEALAHEELKVRMRRDMAIIAIRTARLDDLSGVMVAIADAVAAAGVPVYETADSHDALQCLVEDGKAVSALESLRAAFGLSAEAVTESCE